MKISGDSQLRKLSKENDFDGFSFLPVYKAKWFSSEGKLAEGKTRIDAFVYKSNSDVVFDDAPKHQHGSEYTVLLFTNEFKVTDKFNAVLTEPVEYVIRMVEQGFYGVIGKKTTHSLEYFKKIEQVLVG